MGGEIIPAFYRTMKCNPRPFLVSCYQKVYANVRGEDLVFGVELPNVEVGITSSPEGIIPPASREALRLAGITSAKEFAAALAAVTLGGEFNFATLHVQERMYTGR
jgi:hydroxymethylglutaryl-CoA reductase